MANSLPSLIFDARTFIKRSAGCRVYGGLPHLAASAGCTLFLLLAIARSLSKVKFARGTRATA